MTKTKTELYEVFQGKISKTAICFVDTEYRIVGKFCFIAPVGRGEWGLWLCNPKNLAKGLSTRKLAFLLAQLPQEAAFTKLNGEAYATLQGVDLILNNLNLFGIKKRRRLSEAQRRKAMANLKQSKQVIDHAA